MRGFSRERLQRTRTIRQFDRLAPVSGELLGHLADPEHLGAGYVEQLRRAVDVVQGTQGHGVGVALPDHVEVAHGHVDRLLGHAL